MYTHDLLVFIGRFQPFHNGHLEVIKTALSKASKVLILVGSSYQPRTEKNPFTFDERQMMIIDSIRNEMPDALKRLDIRSLHDHKYNDHTWAAEVQSHISDQGKIGIIGHSKDESSYYLKMFPQWDTIEHPLNDEINATDIRRLLFEARSPNYLNGVVPPVVRTWIADFCFENPVYDRLRQEYEMVVKYKKAWAAAPYAPTFVTVDAVVVQSGHLCLIQRKAAPGEGLWAIPGGFLDQNEYIIDGVIRELREETKIKVPEPVLRGSIKQWQVFDNPSRSSRGRTITHAALIELQPGPLPHIKGSDDAKDARWVPFSEIKEEEMFEDHFHIIRHFIGQI